MVSMLKRYTIIILIGEHRRFVLENHFVRSSNQIAPFNNLKVNVIDSWRTYNFRSKYFQIEIDDLVQYEEMFNDIESTSASIDMHTDDSSHFICSMEV